jgi:hypothetical protein
LVQSSSGFALALNALLELLAVGYCFVVGGGDVAWLELLRASRDDIVKKL